MAKPFITFAEHRKHRAQWVAACLKSMGFEGASYTLSEDTKAARKRVAERISDAACCIALASPKTDDDSAGKEMAPWINKDLEQVLARDVPYVILWEKG